MKKLLISIENGRFLHERWDEKKGSSEGQRRRP